MIYHMIINPIAGRKNTKTHFNFLQQYFVQNNIHAKIYFSKEKSDPQRIASMIEKNNPDGGIIIIFGGDGTIHEVINGINDLNKWSFGIVPMGSGNDLAKSLKIPLDDPYEALDLIMQSTPKKIDYMKINDEYKCINIAGTGVDTDILTIFEGANRLHGTTRYLYAVIKGLLKYKFKPFKVRVDDGEYFTEKPFILCVCNGKQFGGSIKICNDAIINDGYLDFVCCRQIPKTQYIPKMTRLLRGTINKYPPSFYDHRLVKKVEIEKEDGSDFDIEIEGIAYKFNKLKAEIVPQGISIFFDSKQ